MTSDGGPEVALEVDTDVWNRLMAPNLEAMGEWYRILSSDLRGKHAIEALEALLIVHGVPYRKGPGYAG